MLHLKNFCGEGTPWHFCCCIFGIAEQVGVSGGLDFELESKVPLFARIYRYTIKIILKYRQYLQEVGLLKHSLNEIDEVIEGTYNGNTTLQGSGRLECLP